MSKTQEQFNSEYADLCTKLGHAFIQKRQAQLDVERFQNDIEALRKELAEAVEAAKQAELTKQAEAAKDVSNTAPVA